MLDETTLVQDARAGDRQAVDELARLYRSHLLNYFRARTWRDAEDLAQTTLMHTVVRLDRFRSESSFRHYVFSIARRILAHHVRTLAAEHQRIVPSELDPVAENHFGDNFDLQAISPTVELAVQALSLPFRQVVEAHLAGFDNLQIAKALELEYHTVRSRLSRGLSRVRNRSRLQLGLETADR